MTPLLWSLFLYMFGSCSAKEFWAGTFIITQRSLDEAPFRYAGILRKALDKMETKDPPAQSDEENCSVRYRIRPSGRRSKLQLQDDTLSFKIKANNTLVLGAKVFTEVTARTWIWKGFNFGLLGCLKITSCNGELVTYSSTIDFKISFQVLWNDATNKKLAIHIKPIKTILNNVNVAGCRPPWYLRWFKRYRSLLNTGVREAIQEYAKNYEKLALVPEEFSPHSNVFVRYVITDLVWARRYIAVQAKATFSALVEGQNVTYIPKNSVNNLSVIPAEEWQLQSALDSNSHLLQGVRLSTEFINSLIWYASITNITEYHGTAAILDSQVNGTISYASPIIRVEENNLLGIDITYGLILAKCRPQSNKTASGAILFKAEFTNLIGSGRVQLYSTKDTSGFMVKLDNLDLTRLKTKPFEPKLPLPEAFESELMKKAISQLQPVINKYLGDKPVVLPPSVAPLAAYPVLNLWSVGNGSGYAEVLSYCTCGNSSKRFVNCDARSSICDPQYDVVTDVDDDEEDQEEKTNEKGISLNIKDVVKDILETAGNAILGDSRWKDFNETFQGYLLTLYKNDLQCLLEKPGSSAESYWVWQNSRCNPFYVKGRNSFRYYMFNNTFILLGCYDNKCRDCQLTFPWDSSSRCIRGEDGYSLQINLRDRTWQSKEGQDIIAHVFFDGDNCTFKNEYTQSQWISNHMNIGLGNESSPSSFCKTINESSFFSVYNASSRILTHGRWDCSDRICEECSFELKDVPMDICTTTKFQTRVILTLSEGVSIDPPLFELLPLSHNLIYIYCGVSILVVTLILIVVSGIVWKRKTIMKYSSTKKMTTSKAIREIRSDMFKPWAKDHFGFRPFLYVESKVSTATIAEDVIQNAFLLANGITALIFAMSWENNPLYLAQEKFSTSGPYFQKVFNLSQIEEFTDTVNGWVFSVNVFNGVVSLSLIMLWLWTKTGNAQLWTRLRFLTSLSSLVTTFLVLAIVIFSTYFDELVRFNDNHDIFILQNDYAPYIVQVCIRGLSLTVISFTIVFLFHGVGGGLFCGTAFFRLTHLSSPKHQESLSTLLIILTVLQPFVCIHPVIIFSQDSKHNTQFLTSIIMVWFLPIGVHVCTKTLLKHIRCVKERFDTDRLSFIFDSGVQCLQMLLFLVTFAFITHYVIKTEFDKRHKHLQEFILPAIVSVFFWMMSTAYYLLSLVLTESQHKSPSLMFKDQNLDQARNLLNMSLRNRLSQNVPNRVMRSRSMSKSEGRARTDGSRTLPSVQIRRPHRPPPLPPPRSVQTRIKQFEMNSINDESSIARKITEGLAPIKSVDMESCEVITMTKLDHLKTVYHFLLETYEYKDPQTHGWRIKFRRLFLISGVILFTLQTVSTTIATQNYSSKDEIQKLLDMANMNLTWPDSRSALDDVFDLYNDIERTKSYIQICSVILFWSSLLLDFASHFSRSSLSRKLFLFSASRQSAVLGSVAVFISVIIVGFPDYLEASNLDTICPFCGAEFNLRIRQAAEFAIGFFFACLFTFQLIPILLTIIPALVRASVLILIHPSLHVESDNETTRLRITILQQVIRFSSLLTFPITFVSMAILEQTQKNMTVTVLILVFWSVPPVILFLGLYYAKKYKRTTILLYIYYVYNYVYVFLILAIVLKSLTIEKVVKVSKTLVQKPTFWTSFLAQIFLCNVVISDMLYMTVF